MSDGHVYFAEQVGLDALTGWLVNWFKAGGFRLGMRPDKTDLDYFLAEQARTEVMNWWQGRVFSQVGELRWQQRSGQYAAWLLSETIVPPATFEPVEGGPWQAVPGHRPPLYLWGSYRANWSQQQPTWIEVRIARPLHYPVKRPASDAKTEALFVRLGHIEYQAPNGAVQFTRLTEVT